MVSHVTPTRPSFGETYLLFEAHLHFGKVGRGGFDVGGAQWWSWASGCASPCMRMVASSLAPPVHCCCLLASRIPPSPSSLLVAWLFRELRTSANLASKHIKQDRLFCMSFAAHAVVSPAPHLTPLFERPAIHSAAFSSLLSWRAWARELALSVGSKYLEADGGPDSNDLLRELDWLLEDAVDHCSSSPVTSYGKAKSSWRDIEQSANLGKDSFVSGSVVHLRASLEELRKCWKQRICERRPFQYIVGCAHWRDLVLCVQEGVLIPRPETEMMIDLAEEAIKANGSLRKGMWVDLGTGSGALAIGLGLLLGSEGSVIAVDAFDEAIYTARQNVLRYNLQDKVNVLQGSWLSPLRNKKGELAGILSNPPYIPSDCIPSVQAEVSKHEPRSALDGGQEGMDELMKICEGASWALQAGGYLALETNGGRQAEAVAELLRSMSGFYFHVVHIVEDCAGIPRFVTAVHG
eukprot:c6242_g1_i1 orf=320-1711(-)